MDENAASLGVVQAMIEAWRALDWPRVLSLFAEDATLQIMPMPAFSGRAAIKEHLDATASGIERLEFDIKHLLAFGSVVLFERDDVFVYQGRAGRVPVVGVLEVAGGHVTAWREYLDMRSMGKAMGG